MLLGLFYFGISLTTLVTLIIVVHFSYKQERKYNLLGKGGK